MIIRFTKKNIELLIFLALAGIIIWLYAADFSKSRAVEFGVTFSQKYASDLHLDWQKTLTAMLDDLKIRKFRLVAYWDLIEKNKDNYNFADLDWQVKEIAKRGGQAVLVIGHRVPRWPECHWPDWTYRLSDAERADSILKLLKETVTHFKPYQNIMAWQVENEPFLKVFGRCPTPDNNLYKQEVALVKSLDSRPAVVTESGELSTWLRGGLLADNLGVSIYRITWSNLFGYFYYPLPPAFYYLKAGLVKLLTGVKVVFISEMQMEPWLPMSILATPLADQYHSMDLAKFDKNLAYVKRTGLSPVYFWGAEWWYWLKAQGDASIWNEAKKIWK
ncbi:MAG: cellulase family glycosylhydrolase [Candidatus Komeilibacteria bacterium]|nr:cellulase family glycosylhydrolase [Candidatus Komeilibacteria bacterium]